MPEIPTKTVDIDRRSDIGRLICKFQKDLGEGESMKLVFIDGGTSAGMVTLTRVEDGPLFRVVGNIYPNTGNDRGVDVDFMCEPDGPEHMPISVKHKVEGKWVRRFYNGDEDSEYGDTDRAAFYASGVNFTAANAPKVKGIVPGTGGDTSSKYGAKLSNAAKAVEKVWTRKDNKAIWAGVQKRREAGEFGTGKASHETAKQEFRRLQSLGEASFDGLWHKKMPLPVNTLETVVSQAFVVAEQMGVKVTASAKIKIARIISEAPVPAKRTDVIRRAKRVA